MDINPLDAVEASRPAPQESKPSRLNPAVAITIALLATFMGICKVKDDNIVQAMQQAQADKIDHWAFYQARNLREEIAKSTLVQLRLQAMAATAPQQAAYQEQIAAYEKLAKEQNQKKEELKTQAEKDQVTYDALNFHDDQFDLSDALLAIAISLLAVASLTQLWWLYGVSLIPAGFGFLMGLAGLAGWSIHPGVLIGLLS
jgi:ribosomal protein L12E/L44/L45/RPP1/RPP2